VSSSSSVFVLSSTLLVLTTIVGFLIYVVVKYSPIVGEILVQQPLFLPLRINRVEGGEDVFFRTSDGLNLAGTYFKARTPFRSGVIVFCHEYLSNRWSYQPYADHLRDQGFDVFTFDFRSHGESPADARYKPLHWVTDHEERDLQAALTYLRTRSDADPAGVGLFGVSRGGGTALCVASKDPRVWGVVTDGAFPTRGMMLSFMLRWAEIYVGNPLFWKMVPVAVFDFLGWSARFKTGRKLHCRYANVERAASRVAPRPWLAIHGQKDAYVSVNVARDLFDRAGEPKELWIVEGAKHNRCREKDPVAYLARISTFVKRFAPRSQPEQPLEDKVPVSTSIPFDQVPIQSNLGMVVPG
jgi:alpha-beta hydrolase superfamily lysophospholipase